MAVVEMSREEAQLKEGIDEVEHEGAEDADEEAGAPEEAGEEEEASAEAESEEAPRLSRAERRKQRAAGVIATKNNEIAELRRQMDELQRRVSVPPPQAQPAQPTQKQADRYEELTEEMDELIQSISETRDPERQKKLAALYRKKERERVEVVAKGSAPPAPVQQQQDPKATYHAMRLQEEFPEVATNAQLGPLAGLEFQALVALGHPNEYETARKAFQAAYQRLGIQRKGAVPDVTRRRLAGTSSAPSSSPSAAPAAPASDFERRSAAALFPKDSEAVRLRKFRKLNQE